jgi:hypothetical protein
MIASSPPSKEVSLNREAAALELAVDAGPGADAEELERLAHSLRAELLQLDVEAVEPAVDGPAPDRARAVEALVVGALVVRLARESKSLSSLVHAVRGWLGADAQRKVRIELDGDVIELTGSSDEERQRLVDAWIERHGSG